MSIRRKILIPMILLTAACSAAVLVSSILLYNRELINTLNEDIHFAAMTVAYGIDHAKSSSYRAAVVIAENQDIINALKDNDRSKILSVANNILAATDVEFCSFIDNKGNVLARTHMPEQYGDNVAWQPSVVTALAGEAATVIDRGTSVILSVRTAAPIFGEDGNILGAVTLGYRLDTADFVKNLKSITGCEITMLAGNIRIATTITDEHGEYAIGTKTSDDISKKVLAGEFYIGKADVLNREMVAEYAPLYSAGDDVVGMMFVGKYTEEDKNKLLIFVMHGILITLILLAATAVIAMFISSIIDRQLNSMMAAVRDSERRWQESENRLQMLFDAAPIGINLWNKDAKNYYVNDAAVKVLGLSGKEEYYERFFDLSPEYQPDGRLSSEKGSDLLKETFANGYSRHEWLHQKLDGELVPCDVTMVRINYGEDCVIAVYTYDLREIRAAYAEANAAQEHALILFNALPMGCILWDKKYNLIDCNQAIVDLFGAQDKEDFITHYHEHAPEHQPDGHMSVKFGLELVQKAFDEGYQRFEWLHKRKNGEPLPVETILVRVIHKGEDVVAEYVRDLREEKAMVKQIQDANRNRDTLLESLDAMLVITSLETDEIIFMNDVMKKTFGFGDDIVGKKCWQHISKGDGGRCAICPKNDPDCISGKPYIRENFHPVVKREYRIISRVIDWPDGSKVFLEQCDDITDLKIAIEKTKTLSSLENILNGIDAMICVTDPITYTVLFINDTMRKIFGVDDDCIGKPCYKYLRKLDQRCGFCPCPKLEQEPDKVILWEQYHPLTNRFYRHYSKYVTWLTGQPVHVQLAVDITDIRDAEREITEKNEHLKIAIQKAEAANKAKSIFLANMSHEIRTPMNAILGITEIQLREENLSPRTEEGLEKIYDAGNLLLNIINDILDLSKIEAGKLEIIPVKYDIPSLINDTVQINRFRYDSKPIEFFLDIDENTPLNMFGDELRIKQILGNILSNAFKYTEQGEVRLSVSCETLPAKAGQDDNVTLVFCVSDTGRGMTPEQLDKVFDEYTRFNLETARTTGTGLGMSITKRLVELMNGKIIVQSEADKGSLFTVRLPQKRINGLVCGKETAEKLRNLRFQSSSVSKKSRMMREYMPYGNVLIVDDVSSNIYVASGMLMPYGLQIDTASSGLDAIEKVKKGNVYDIIFMDHMMPNMDGIEAAKIIRDMGYKKPIVALTANALVGQAEVFLENGFDGYISKPIDSRELNQLLNVFIRNKKPPEVVKAARREQRMSAERQAKQASFGMESSFQESSFQESSFQESSFQEGEKNKNGILSHEINSAEVKKFFVIDSENAITELEGIFNKSNEMEDAQINSYEITVHGIKSALANIGETELSAYALKLEKAAMEKNLAMIKDETPAFINALRELNKKIISDDVNKETGMKNKVFSVNKEQLTDEDAAFLREKLNEIKKACIAYDSNAANTALNDLLQKTWVQEVDDILDEINVYLLHRSFRKMISVVDNALEMYEEDQKV